MSGCILVVEHDRATRELLAGNLKDAGYRVFCAGDVSEAEAAVREIRPDLTLLDWWLPGALGLAFARQMRGDRRTAHVSIIALSARSEQHDRIAAPEGGAAAPRSSPTTWSISTTCGSIPRRAALARESVRSSSAPPSSACFTSS